MGLSYFKINKKNIKKENKILVNNTKKKMNYKNIFNTLTKISDDVRCAINIILVIGNIRPAFWYDCWDLDSKKMNKMLKYLYTFSKYGIKYKFKNETYLKNNKSHDEGPLIYNEKKLNKKYIKIIENNDIKDIYNKKIFGEILGYSCPVDILRINRINYSTIDFIFQYKKYYTFQIYGFFCLTKNIKNIMIDLKKKAEKMDRFVKKINKDYIVELIINR